MAGAKDDHALRALAMRRWRIALALTVAMMVTYFGFILLVAYGKEAAGALVSEGLSLGILLGALVIVVAWGVTGIYVYWANKIYDAELDRLHKAAESAS